MTYSCNGSESNKFITAGVVDEMGSSLKGYLEGELSSGRNHHRFIGNRLAIEWMPIYGGIHFFATKI